MTAARAGDPVARFAEAAERFCAWVEREPEVPDWELETATRFLLELTARALDLPDVDGDEDEGAEPDHAAAYAALRQRFAVLPVGLYGTVDPTDVVGDTPLTGDVIDDLSDVWRDVRRGLDAHRAGRIDEACWQWRFTFRSHWGRHAAEALRVLVLRRNEI